MIVTSVQIKTVKTQKHLYCPVFTFFILMKAQRSWLEYLLDMQGVGGSSPLVFTKIGKNPQILADFLCNNYATRLRYKNHTLHLSGRYPVFLFKGAVEYRIIAEAALRICPCWGYPRKYKLLCHNKPFCCNIFTHGHCRGFFKYMAKVRFAYIIPFANNVQT